MNDHPLRQEHTWIETAEVLQAKKPALVNEPDKEADFVHVRRDQDGWAATSTFRGDQVPEAIGTDIVHQRRQFDLHHRADTFFEAGDADG
jgi:hypothetical protein